MSDMRGRAIRRRVRTGLAYTLLAGYAIVSLYPFLFMVTGALKTNTEIVMSPGLIPREPTLEVIRSTFEQLNFGRYFLNTVIVAASTIGLQFLVYPAAAFAFALLQFRGRDTLFRILVGMLFVPGVASLVPLLIILQRLGLMDSWLGVILPAALGGAPITLYLVRNYFRMLPRELFEAARIDGASTFTIFRSVYLPLAVPALATIGIMSLIAAWSMFILPNLVLSDKDLFTLPLGVFNLRASAAPQWNVLMAASLIVVTPVIIAFVALQRYYISGLTAGMGKT